MKTSQVVKDDIIELMNIMYKVINRKKKNKNKIYTCECFRHDKNSIIEIGNQRIM